MFHDTSYSGLRRYYLLCAPTLEQNCSTRTAPNWFAGHTVFNVIGAHRLLLLCPGLHLSEHPIKLLAIKQATTCHDGPDALRVANVL